MGSGLGAKGRSGTEIGNSARAFDCLWVRIDNRTGFWSEPDKKVVHASSRRRRRDPRAGDGAPAGGVAPGRRGAGAGEGGRPWPVHQTGHNSGVVHAGLYYAPGSLKARLCTRGRELMKEFCAEKGVVYDECGKVVVATRQTEVGPLRRLHRARATDQRRARPALAGRPPSWPRSSPTSPAWPALHSPHTAIVDFVAVANAMRRGRPRRRRRDPHRRPGGPREPGRRRVRASSSRRGRRWRPTA